MNYQNKYLKYKTKYLNLKQIAGNPRNPPSFSFPPRPQF